MRGSCSPLYPESTACSPVLLVPRLAPLDERSAGRAGPWRRSLIATADLGCLRGEQESVGSAAAFGEREEVGSSHDQLRERLERGSDRDRSGVAEVAPRSFSMDEL